MPNKMLMFIFCVPFMCLLMSACVPKQETKELEKTDTIASALISSSISSPQNFETSWFSHQKRETIVRWNRQYPNDPLRIPDNDYLYIKGRRMNEEKRWTGEGLARCTYFLSDNGLADQEIRELFNNIGFAEVTVSTESLSGSSFIEYREERYLVVAPEFGRTILPMKILGNTQSKKICDALAYTIRLKFNELYYEFALEEKYYCDDHFSLLSGFYKNEDQINSFLAEHGVEYLGFYFIEEEYYWNFLVMFREKEN